MHCKNTFKYFLLLIFLLQISSANSQVANAEIDKRFSVFFSLGYGLQYPMNSTIHVIQYPLKNDYYLSNVTATGQAAGGTSFSFKQLSWHIGFFYNYNQSRGFELCYDPYLYYLTADQKINANGTMGGNKFSKTLLYNSKNNYYNLHDGTGALQVNYITRFGLFRSITHNFALDLIGRFGLGIVMPRSESSLDTVKIHHFSTNQFAGVCAGTEVGLRVVTHKRIYLELNYKINYASLLNVSVYEGTATQLQGTNMVLAHLGILLPATKRNPLFLIGWPHRKVITKPKPMYKKETDY